MNSTWRLALAFFFVSFVFSSYCSSQTLVSREDARNGSPSLPRREDIKQFLCGHIEGFCDQAALDVSSPRASNFPGFFEITLSLTAHDQTQSSEMYIAENGGYLVAGKLYGLSGGDVNEQIVNCVRNRFNVQPNSTFTVSPRLKSIFPGLDVVTVTPQQGGLSENFFITTDEQVLVVAAVNAIAGHPSKKQIMETISTIKAPQRGSRKPPVTIVEYADLECPSCAQLNSFLENEVLPKYAKSIRIVYKEFPLTIIHRWALPAAIAAECVYQYDPEAFATYRSLIFEHQADFAQANARDELLRFASDVGANRTQLSSCLDSSAPLDKIQKDLLEGESIGVSSTPTIFLNGESFIGTTRQELYSAVDKAIKKQ